RERIAASFRALAGMCRRLVCLGPLPSTVTDAVTVLRDQGIFNIYSAGAVWLDNRDHGEEGMEPMIVVNAALEREEDSLTERERERDMADEDSDGIAGEMETDWLQQVRLGFTERERESQRDISEAEPAKLANLAHSETVDERERKEERRSVHRASDREYEREQHRATKKLCPSDPHDRMKAATNMITLKYLPKYSLPSLTSPVFPESPIEESARKAAEMWGASTPRSSSALGAMSHSPSFTLRQRKGLQVFYLCDMPRIIKGSTSVLGRNTVQYQTVYLDDEHCSVVII
ncbi:hypothetical protein KIPB_010051, partial [Kipferlia bialata]